MKAGRSMAEQYKSYTTRGKRLEAEAMRQVGEFWLKQAADLNSVAAAEEEEAEHEPTGD